MYGVAPGLSVERRGNWFSESGFEGNLGRYSQKMGTGGTGSDITGNDTFNDSHVT